ncbi:hypothetical protein PM082_014346 [Marasmius tenuissimus]|nr:hypothetical protein PM082_014346 [Marasmius tenuissimus]
MTHTSPTSLSHTCWNTSSRQSCSSSVCSSDTSAEADLGTLCRPRFSAWPTPASKAASPHSSEPKQPVSENLLSAYSLAAHAPSSSRRDASPSTWWSASTGATSPIPNFTTPPPSAPVPTDLKQNKPKTSAGKSPTAHLIAFISPLTPLANAQPVLFSPHLSPLLSFLTSLVLPPADPV